jgi:Carboxypeptidase regulatory-like domain
MWCISGHLIARGNAPNVVTGTVIRRTGTPSRHTAPETMLPTHVHAIVRATQVAPRQSRGARNTARHIVFAALAVLGLGRVPLLSAAPATHIDSSGTLSGVLVGKEDGQPVPYGTVLLVETGEERFTDASGAFRLGGIVPGTYTVRARQIGYAPKDTTVQIAPAPAVTTVSIHLSRLPVILRVVRVKGHRSDKCVAAGIPDSTVDPALASLFTQVRENVDRYRLLMREYPFRYAREEQRFTRYDPEGIRRDVREAVDTAVFESRARRPYHIGGILYYDNDAAGRRLLYMYLPTFGELGDSAFLASHCFRYGGDTSDAGRPGEDLVRVDFAPLARINQPDVSGSVYLDTQSLTVRRAVFEMTKPDAVRPPVVGFKVTTSFRELVPLVPLMDSVETEQPIPGKARVPPGAPASGDPGDYARRVAIEVIQRYRVLNVEFESSPGGPARPPPITPPADSTALHHG